MIKYSITLVSATAGPSNAPPCANTPRVGDARPFAPLLATSASPKLETDPVDAMVIKLISLITGDGLVFAPVAKIPLVESENPAPCLKPVLKSPKSFPPPPDGIVT